MEQIPEEAKDSPSSASETSGNQKQNSTFHKNKLLGIESDDDEDTI